MFNQNGSATIPGMWNKILGVFLGISKSLVTALAPILQSALSDLLVKAKEKAVYFVKKAAEDGSFPDGAARHAWVVSEIKPLLEETAKEYLPAIRDAIINLGVKAAYETTVRK